MFGENSSFERKSFERGELILKEGDNISNLYILSSGKVLNFSIKNGRVVPLHLAEDSGVVGEDCVLSKERISQYSAICLSNVQAISIPRQNVLQYINESSKWIKDLIFNISSRSVNTTKVIVDHQIKDDSLFGGESLNAGDEKLILEKMAKR